MGRIEASKLKEMLSIDDIKKVYLSLGGNIKQEREDKWVCSTICHNASTTGISYKLEFYTKSKTFHCYTRCNESFNIFSLVMKRKKLLGEVITFPQALEYVCDVCGIAYESATRVTKKVIMDNWQQSLEKYMRTKSKVGGLTTYDKSILDFFPTIYHQSWLDFGIGIDTLEKYNIKYYPYKNQIVIPVYDDEGDLVGIRVRNLLPELLENGMKYIPLMLANGTQYKFPTNAVLYGLNYNKEAIQRLKKCILVESEKSVLKLDTWLGEDNVAVATLGSSLGKFRRDKLLKLGIEEIIILSDKDYHEIGDVEYQKWEKKQKKLIGEFKGYCKVSLIWDNLDEDLLEYKANAVDYDKDTFDKLYNEREVIE